MKKVMFLIVLIVSISSIHAQYSTYKSNYDVKSYLHEDADKYNPSVAGALAIIPGLGHVYSGEPLRGLAFFGGVVGSAGVGLVGVYMMWTDVQVLPYVLFFTGCAAVICSYVWNITDAVKVAKIKNLALRDKPLTLHVEPMFDVNIRSVQKYSVGVSLTLEF